MVSRIDIGPDGGPYVEIDEDAGDLVIRVPNDTVDFDSNDLLNAVLQNATMEGGSLDGVSLASALDANNQDLNSVGTASVTALEAESVSTESVSTESVSTESVSTDDATITSGQSATTPQLTEWHTRSNDDADIVQAVGTHQISADGDLKALYESQQLNVRPRFGFLIVCGIRDDDVTDAFTDLLLLASRESFSVAGSSERGSPATRSYSSDADVGYQIAIDDGGVPYDLYVTVPTAVEP